MRQVHPLAIPPAGMMIRAARQTRQWSRRRLALAIPIAEEHLGRWERGDRPIPLPMIVRMAAVLHAPELLQAACAHCPIAQAGADREVA